MMRILVAALPGRQLSCVLAIECRHLGAFSAISCGHNGCRQHTVSKPFLKSVHAAQAHGG